MRARQPAVQASEGSACPGRPPRPEIKTPALSGPYELYCATKLASLCVLAVPRVQTYVPGKHASLRMDAVMTDPSSRIDDETLTDARRPRAVTRKHRDSLRLAQTGSGPLSLASISQAPSEASDGSTSTSNVVPRTLTSTDGGSGSTRASQKRRAVVSISTPPAIC